MPVVPITVTLMRGGTSKGVFIRLADLPEDAAERDSLALRLLGSPDPMQLDGLGGAQSSTSKLMAVGSIDEAHALGYSVPPGHELAYLFGQVGIAQGVVDWRGNCGNLTAAVAPYAIHEGMIQPAGAHVTVRLFNLNTATTVVAEVPLTDGDPSVDGDFAVAGVPGTGAAIAIVFLGHDDDRSDMFPTGLRQQEITVNGNVYGVTMVDVNNPVVIVRATDVGLRGTESPAELNSDPGLLARLEAIRGEAALLMGIVDALQLAQETSPATPRVMLVSAPQPHVSTDGTPIGADDCDVVVRMTSMGRIHHAIPGTGLTAAGVAVLLEGTVANQVSRPVTRTVRVAHPSGVVSTTADVEDDRDVARVRSVTVLRTARRLMHGTAFVRG